MALRRDDPLSFGFHVYKMELLIIKCLFYKSVEGVGQNDAYRMIYTESGIH